MLEGCYLVSHGGTVPGREGYAAALFARSRAFWQGQERQGRVRIVGPFFLTPSGGTRDDMAFFTLYQGKLADLHQIVTSEEYERIYAVAAQVTKNLTGRLYGGGTDAEIARIMSVSGDEWSKAGLAKG